MIFGYELLVINLCEQLQQIKFANMSENLEITKSSERESPKEIEADSGDFFNKRQRRLSTTSLAFEALSIVLQHWMIPYLGWNFDLFEKRQKELRKIITKRLFDLKNKPNSSVEGEDVHTLKTCEQYLIQNSYHILSSIKADHPDYIKSPMNSGDIVTISQRPLTVSYQTLYF